MMHTDGQASAWAKELLELARISRSAALDPQQEARWRELTRELFEYRGTDRRRSLRVPREVQAEVRIRHGVFSCTFGSLSATGMSMAGDVIKYVTNLEPVRILSITVDGHHHALDLSCQVTSVSHGSGGTTRAGLAISTDSSPEGHETYFMKIYVPAYLQYLESLEGKAGSESSPWLSGAAPPHP